MWHAAHARGQSLAKEGAERGSAWIAPMLPFCAASAMPCIPVHAAHGWACAIWHRAAQEDMPTCVAIIHSKTPRANIMRRNGCVGTMQIKVKRLTQRYRERLIRAWQCTADGSCRRGGQSRYSEDDACADGSWVKAAAKCRQPPIRKFHDPPIDPRKNCVIHSANEVVLKLRGRPGCWAFTILRVAHAAERLDIRHNRQNMRFEYDPRTDQAARNTGLGAPDHRSATVDTQCKERNSPAVVIQAEGRAILPVSIGHTEIGRREDSEDADLRACRKSGAQQDEGKQCSMHGSLDCETLQNVHWKEPTCATPRSRRTTGLRRLSI
jgi:hypothetical protein